MARAATRGGDRAPVATLTGTWIGQRPGLLLLTGVSLALRLVTITWGLPGGADGALHPDERKYLAPAIHFVGYYMTDRPFPLYGTSLQFTIGPFLAPFDVASRWTDTRELYALLANLFCRGVVVVLGALAIPLLYRFAEEVYDRRTALLSACLLTVAPYHVLNSSFFTVDAPMATLLLVNLLLLLRLLRDPRPGPCALAGLAFGYLLGTKLTAGVYLVVPIALILGRRPAPALDAKRIAVFAAVALLAFAALNPHYLLGFDAVSERAALDRVDFFERTAPDTWTEAAAEQWHGYVEGVGLPILLAALGGIAVGIARAPRITYAWLALLTAYGLFFRHFMLPRYTIFVTPILCLLAGSLLAWLLSRAGVASRIAGLVALVLVLGLSAAITAAGITSRLYDPRIRAARFIAESYPPGTTIGFGIESEAYSNAHRWRFPALYRSDHLAIGVLEGPDVVVTSSEVMDRVEKALHSPHLHGDYVWSAAENRWWYRSSPPSPALFRFYADLLVEREYRASRSFEIPVPEALAAEFVVRRVVVYERR